MAKIILLVCILEFGAWVCAQLLQRKWAMYRDPAEAAGAISYEEYVRIRDPVLGWPRTEEFGEGYDFNGAQWCRESGVDDSARWSLSVYGDSYTADSIGGDTDRWCCRIERLTGTRVENWGVAGYGTDQAFLRYLQNDADEAELVVLAHMASGILRNLTRYRDFQTGSRDLAFKPRFILQTDGALELVPIPELSLGDYRRFLALDSPQLVLPHESFHPNGPMGAVRSSFPYTLAVLRNSQYWRLRARLAGFRPHEVLYDPEHPREGLGLTLNIMLEFARTAKERGQKALLMVFPGRSDVERQRKTGGWIYQGLVDELRQAGFEPFDFGVPLLSHYGDRPVEEIFGTGSNTRRLHYGMETSHLVADALIAHLNSTGLLELPLKED